MSCFKDVHQIGISPVFPPEPAVGAHSIPQESLSGF